MIQLQNVTAGYGGPPVLRDVTLDLCPGEVLALLGPNGCGKSTLLRAAAGLQPLSGGQVLVDGTSVSTLTRRQLAQTVAYLPQSRGVPNITAYRMVLHGRFPYLSYPRRYRPEDHAAARRALEEVEAAQLAPLPVPTLSGGQRQKVYLAMALAQDTPVILLDEPTAYLDVAAQLEVTALARRLAGQGRAVALVLHDLSLALGGADRVALLGAGRLAGLGRPEELFASGALDRVFGVSVRRVKTPEGWQYYCVSRG